MACCAEISHPALFKSEPPTSPAFTQFLVLLVCHKLSRSCIQNYRRESADWRPCYPMRGEFPDCPPNKGEKSGICLNPRRGSVRTLFHLRITCGSLVFCQEFRNHANNVRSIAPHHSSPEQVQSKALHAKKASTKGSRSPSRSSQKSLPPPPLQGGTRLGIQKICRNLSESHPAVPVKTVQNFPTGSRANSTGQGIAYRHGSAKSSIEFRSTWSPI